MSSPGRPAAPATAGTAPAPRPAGVANVANALTLLRLLLVPVVAGFLLFDGGTVARWRVVAFVAFVVASVTDRVDGSLARRRGLVTNVGKVADPLADKALVGACLVSLSVLGLVPWWVTLVLLAREGGVTLLRLLVIRHGIIPASSGGKVKTFLQGIAIGLYLLPLPAGWPHQLRWGALLGALAVTIVTGIDYVARAWVLRRTSERARARARAGGGALR